jgi:hypothetical protein
MKRICLRLATLVAFSALVALAADIDGTWTAETQGRRGPQTQTLTLKADGSKLTGSLGGGRGEPVQISEGMINGNDVMFKVVREFNGNKIEQNYKGTLSGDDLKLTMDAGRGPQEIAFKRAK